MAWLDPQAQRAAAALLAEQLRADCRDAPPNDLAADLDDQHHQRADVLQRLQVLPVNRAVGASLRRGERHQVGAARAQVSEQGRADHPTYFRIECSKQSAKLCASALLRLSGVAAASGTLTRMLTVLTCLGTAIATLFPFAMYGVR